MSAASSIRVAGFLSRRAITRGNHSVVALTILVMAVIFAQLLFIPALIQGATERIKETLRNSLTSDIAITPQGSSLTIADPQSVVAEARATPGVSAATATVLAGTQVSSESKTGSWSVAAVEPGSYRATFTIADDMIEGTFLEPDDIDGIVLGVGIAGADQTAASTYRTSLESIHAGDQVTVTLVDGQTHAFAVRGIYDTQLAQANQRAFISSSAAERLVPPLHGQANAVFVAATRLGDVQAIIDQLAPARPDLDYQSWESLSSTVKDLTGSFNLIKQILNVVSLLVAAITVFIVTYVDLVAKRRAIGIERAIGIRGIAITMSYAAKAIVFATIGVAIGSTAFLFMVVPLVRQHPFDFPVGPVTLSVTRDELRRDTVVLIIVAAAGAVLPAWRTTRVRILDAIWG
jgi:putative ABC transport system permease protein